MVPPPTILRLRTADTARRAPMAAPTAVALAMLISVPWTGATDTLPYRSPFDLAYSPDGATLAVSDRTASVVAFLDAARGDVIRQVRLRGQPTAVAWNGNDRLLVAEYDAGTVADVDVSAGEVARRFSVGVRPLGVALAARRSLLVVANTVENDVSIVDLKTGKERSRIRVPREPFFVAITPDESVAVVGNLLPAGSASDPKLAAVVSLIALEASVEPTHVRLPPGSTSVRQIAISPDGLWAYVAHTLGRFNVPATQLDRGWVNTNAFTIIDLARKEPYASLLLDQPYEGAADPWGVALSPDGSTLWITQRGTHELARVDVARLHGLLAGKLPESLGTASASDASSRTIWHEIRADRSRIALLMNDLSALYAGDVIERVALSGRGPHAVAVSPDGAQLAVAQYYSGSVALVSTATAKVSTTLALGPSREPDAARRGEMVFHDATICFQRWLSCSTCHPDNGRTDGLRWDLLNDGIGTPQRTRSLLLSHKIRPTTSRGVREGIEDSVPKGLIFLLHMPDKELVEPLIAYLSSLEPEPSPFLVGGELSAAARRGEELFRDKAGCVSCHTGELRTDQKHHNVGTRGEFDRPTDEFYTPRLVELYRAAPFLHDGRAANLRDVFTIHDPQGRHGSASELTPSELEDLVEYLNSL